MNLATTALRAYWPADPPLLLLGGWCVDVGPGGVPPGARVLPCPWNDRARYYRAIEEADRTIERLLPPAAEALNRLHGERRTTDYWRTVAGPWLIQYVHALSDRYTLLRDALREEPNLTTWVPDRRPPPPPRDTLEHLDWLGDDRYNLSLLACLSTRLGISTVIRPAPSEGAPPFPSASHGGPGFKPPWVRWSARAVDFLLGGRRRGLLAELNVSQWDTWKLVLKTGGRMLPWSLGGESRLPASPDAGRRETIRLDCKPTTELESLALDLFKDCLPESLVENYQRTVALVERRLPSPVRAIVSGNGWHCHESFKAMAARERERGARLISVQHGGGYGVHRYSPVENHERRVTDAQWWWGWSSPSNPAERNVPHPRLPFGPGGPGGPLYFVGTSQPRYLFRFQSMPVGSQWEEYFGWQTVFFRELDPAVRGRTVVRPYPTDYGRETTRRLTNQFPDLEWDRHPRVERGLARASLVVIDHCNTLFLKTLAADIPTLIFWDPRRWEWRPEAQPFLDDLAAAGLWCSNPADAARQAGRVFPDPTAWWNAPARRKARRAMVDRYARTDPRWIDAWARNCREAMA